MRGVIEQLYALQKVDSSLRAIRLELAALETSASQLRVEVGENRALAAARRQEFAEVERRRRDVEGTLRAEEQRTRNARMRMMRIRNEKEASALRREIEMSRETIGLLEEELLQLMEASDGKGAELRSLEETLVVQERTLAERQQRLAERKAALKDEFQRATGERSARAAEIDQDLLRRYELIFNRRSGLAVVEVREDGCAGCGLRLPPQLLNQLHRGVDLIVCPNCQRILWITAPQPPAAEG